MVTHVMTGENWPVSGLVVFVHRVRIHCLVEHAVAGGRGWVRSRAGQGQGQGRSLCRHGRLADSVWQAAVPSRPVQYSSQLLHAAASLQSAAVVIIKSRCALPVCYLPVILLTKKQISIVYAFN